jgi:hypothetical protein
MWLGVLTLTLECKDPQVEAPLPAVVRLVSVGGFHRSQTGQQSVGFVIRTREQ